VVEGEKILQLRVEEGAETFQEVAASALLHLRRKLHQEEEEVAAACLEEGEKEEDSQKEEEGDTFLEEDLEVV
jgi:hypothetical protein